MGVFREERPFSLPPWYGPRGPGRGGDDSLSTTEAMIVMKRQLNNWNWSVTTEVFGDRFDRQLFSFNTEQVWDGTRAGHERLWGALVEHLEGSSDRLGLRYLVHRPAAIEGKPWSTKTPKAVEIDRAPCQ